MTLEPSSIVALVLAAGLVLVAVACTCGLVALRRVRRELETTAGQLAALRRDVEAATAVAVRAGERLRKIEHATGQMGDRLGQLELRGEGRPYDQAIALVQRGADADRLVRNFGLSRGEADLVALVHGRRKAG